MTHRPDRLEMPPARRGFVPTLNGQGFMNTRVHAYMEAFIAFAKTSAAPVADIGAAYGVATIPALEAGATVIAVDLDERHLHILRQRVPVACLERLQTIAASFPEGLRFDPDSIGAFLVSNVVHFFSPDRFQAAAQSLLDWLVDGGKVFLVATSPYLGDCQSFVPEYEARKRAGDPWPGYTTDVMKYAPSWKSMFSSALFLDPDVLSRVFHQAGFIVEKADFIARPDLPPKTQLDGRESVGLIARKPGRHRRVPHG
jgi:SAM-dependent methyltransferase